MIATIKQYRSDLFTDMPYDNSKAISPDNIPDHILDIYNTGIILFFFFIILYTIVIVILIIILFRNS